MNNNEILINSILESIDKQELNEWNLKKKFVELYNEDKLYDNNYIEYLNVFLTEENLINYFLILKSILLYIKIVTVNIIIYIHKILKKDLIYYLV